MASHGIPRTASASVRSAGARDKELQTIREYRELVDTLHRKLRHTSSNKIQDNEYTLAVFDLTSQLLKLNPEYYTLWNERRRIFLRGLSRPQCSDPIETVDASTSTAPDHNLDLMRKELSFLVPLLISFPKCYWIWNHRIWLLQQANTMLSPSTSQLIWAGELSLVSRMLVRDNRNFHGWGYRRYVIQNLHNPPIAPSLAGTDLPTTPAQSMVEQEFQYTTRMIRQNLSNFSAWHQRSILAPKILAERAASDDARRAFLDQEFETIVAALYTDPYNASAWSYHRWLMANYLSTPTDPSSVPIATYNDDEKLLQAHKQLDQIIELHDLESDCKQLVTALLQYTLQLPPQDTKRASKLSAYLAELNRIDPLRTGRWTAIENDLKAEHFGDQIEL